jgi:hypothetical protein
VAQTAGTKQQPARFGTSAAAKTGRRIATVTGMTTTTRPSADVQGHIVQRIDAIEDGESLIRYAVAAQLALLPKDISQRRVGKVLSGGATNLSHALAGKAKFSSQMLRELDEAVDTVATERGHVAGLAQFGIRMRGLRDRSSLTASIPPAWTAGEGHGDIGDTDDELHVLAEASNLLRRFLIAHRLSRGSGSIRDIHRAEIEAVVDRLILIAGVPPTPRNVEAQILLGSLAKYSFELTLERIEHTLRNHPLGFRAWRSLTKLLLLSVEEDDEFVNKGLRARLGRLLKEANKMRANSIYPGRSLDLELAISIPPDWLQTPSGGKQPASVSEMLMERAKNSEASLRERATAAMGLWERAALHGRASDPHVVERMKTLMQTFEAEQVTRPDIASGLRWVNATIEQVMRNDVPVCNDWPVVDEPWFEPITEAADLLEQDNVPAWILPGTKQLFMHILLQNAGVQRRKAIDTLTAGGWVEPVVRALASVLRDDRTESWVRIRAIFALGFMQHRSTTSTETLIAACETAYREVRRADGKLALSVINELHTALFAIGDAFGVPGWEQQALQVRTRLEPMLRDLVENRVSDAEFYLVARGLVYTLTFTAQSAGRAEDLSKELLSKLTEHPDDVTARFAQWALSFRFGENGEVYPILHAARTGG